MPPPATIRRPQRPRDRWLGSCDSPVTLSHTVWPCTHRLMPNGLAHVCETVLVASGRHWPAETAMRAPITGSGASAPLAAAWNGLESLKTAAELFET